jgi:hypothetical protein
MKFFGFSFLVLFVAVSSAFGCDSCGCQLHKPVIYSDMPDAERLSVADVPIDRKDLADGIEKKGVDRFFFAGEQVQYTFFGSIMEDNAHIPNAFHQTEDSLITQTYIGYQFNDRSSIQINLPYIYRAYQRPSDSGLEKGSVSGLGDISLLANFVPYRHEEKTWGMDWTVGAGVKFPTGDPHHLDEELGNENENSGIHGHDLALGSGSYDGIFITGLDFHWEQFFWDAHFEYVLRSTGYIDYRYADEIQWSTGPGYQFVVNDELKLGVQFRVSGSSKTNDTFQGVKATDTAMTDVYVGPLFTLQWSQRLSASMGIDLPVLQDETSLQAVPDYRVRGGVTWRF